MERLPWFTREPSGEKASGIQFQKESLPAPHAGIHLRKECRRKAMPAWPDSWWRLSRHGRVPPAQEGRSLGLHAAGERGRAMLRGRSSRWQVRASYSALPAHSQRPLPARLGRTHDFLAGSRFSAPHLWQQRGHQVHHSGRTHLSTLRRWFKLRGLSQRCPESASRFRACYFQQANGNRGQRALSQMP